jgi:hypothetical protein
MPRSTARNSPEVLGRPIDLQADDRRLHIKRAVLGSHGSQHSKADSTPRLRGTGDDSQCRRPRVGQSTSGEFLRNTLPIIIRCEFTFRLGRTRPARARSSGSEILSGIRSLAGYTIDTHETGRFEPAPRKSSLHSFADEICIN